MVNPDFWDFDQHSQLIVLKELEGNKNKTKQKN